MSIPQFVHRVRAMRSALFASASTGIGISFPSFALETPKDVNANQECQKRSNTLEPTLLLGSPSGSRQHNHTKFVPAM